MVQELKNKIDTLEKRVNVLENNKTIIEQPTKKSIDELAKEVTNGKWGNNPERKKRLEAEGHDYNAVQKRVNELLK